MGPRDFRPEAFFLGSSRDDVIEHLLSFENVDVVLFRLAGRTHISAKQLGLAFSHEADGRISTAFLFADGVQGASECVLELPLGMQFGMGRDEVRAAVGVPVASASDGTGHAMGWDAYLVDGVRIHFEFSQGGAGIELVTLQYG